MVATADGKPIVGATQIPTVPVPTELVTPGIDGQLSYVASTQTVWAWDVNQTTWVNTGVRGFGQ